MRFFLDHDVPNDIGHLLQHWGHEVTRLRDVLDVTTPDVQVFEYVRDRGLIVISCNRNHFLALAGSSTDHPGLIILIRRRTRNLECARLHALLTRAGQEGLAGNMNFA